MSEKKTNYLGIDSGGKVYTKSNATDEGATKVVLKDGTPVYRKYRKYGTIKGKLTNAFIKEVEYSSGKVKNLYIAIEGEAETDMLSFQVFNLNGSISTYIQSIAAVADNLIKDSIYTLNPSKKVNDKGFLNKTIYVNDEKGEWVKLSKEEWDKIPRGVQKKRADGKEYYDFSDRDEYLYKKLEKFLSQFKIERAEYSEQNDKVEVDKKEKQKAAPKEEPVDEVLNDNELPF